MKRRLLISTLIAALATLVLAITASHAAYVRRATVNADNSITIEWVLGSIDVSNTSVAVDCCVVHAWTGLDRSTRFTTAPLPAGRHTITIEVLEMYWTNTDYGPANCDISTRAGFQWLCHWRRWASISVRVSSSRALCVVPRVSGLQLENAKARLKLAGCSLGAVVRRNSDRPLDTVLSQQPTPNKRLPTGTAITLTVSNGHSPT
jgi:hypothetical protein